MGITNKIILIAEITFPEFESQFEASLLSIIRTELISELGITICFLCMILK